MENKVSLKELAKEIEKAGVKVDKEKLKQSIAKKEKQLNSDKPVKK